MKTKIMLVNGPAKGQFEMEHQEDDPIRIGRRLRVGETTYEILVLDDQPLAACLNEIPSTGFGRLTEQDISQPRPMNHNISIDTDTRPFIGLGFEFNVRHGHVTPPGGPNEWVGVLLRYGAEREEIADALQKLVDVLRSGGGTKGDEDRIGSEVNRADYPEANR